MRMGARLPLAPMRRMFLSGCEDMVRGGGWEWEVWRYGVLVERELGRVVVLASGTLRKGEDKVML